MSLSGFSQTVSKQVISPLGGTAFSDTHKLSYTTGEVVVGAMTSEDGSIQLGNGYYPSLDLSTSKYRVGRATIASQGIIQTLLTESHFHHPSHQNSSLR